MSIYLYIYISIYLYFYISIYLYIYISIYLYIYISIYLDLYLYIYTSMYLYIYIHAVGRRRAPKVAFVLKPVNNTSSGAFDAAGVLVYNTIKVVSIKFKKEM